jgi:hypothetical protein
MTWVELRQLRYFVALAVHLMVNTAVAGGTYDIDGGQQLV